MDILTILAAVLVLAALILAVVLVARVNRIDEQRLKELQDSQVDLDRLLEMSRRLEHNIDTLMEMRRLQSRGW